MDLATTFDLRGRLVLLTGASGYLGRAISKAIIAAGGELILCGRTAEKLEALRSQFTSDQQVRCHVMKCDVTVETEVVELQDWVGRRFGHLHGLVNNAYAGRVGKPEAIERADFLTACEYNLITPFMLFKTFHQLLEVGSRRSGQSSSIVNIASMYGTVSPDPAMYQGSDLNNPVHYGATKAGLIQLTRYLACHFGAKGIRVNSIAPGPFPNIDVDPKIPFFFDRLAARVPMNRIGLPAEIGGPVVFLLSSASSFVNGANLPVDGGWTAW